MAKKKKTVKQRKSSGIKKRPARKATKKATARKTVAKKKQTRKSPAQKKAPAKKKPVSRTKRISLGRPKVTGEEKLYMLFKEDFHARQIFTFLGVETVRELEEYSAQEIVKRLSQPIRKTVARIRQKLADKNRYLLDDGEFAMTYKANRT